MTARETQIVIAVLVVLVTGVLLSAGREPGLRTEHARPATVAAVQLPATVAVTPGGKLFHEPSCPYIHGRVVMMDTAAAELLGYTPCTRCMARAYDGRAQHPASR